MTKSKTVLITGASVRVGRAIALSLADGGWDVALHYRARADEARELAALVEQKGRKATLVKADLSKEKEVARIFPALGQKGVVPDCLINNAATFERDTLATLTQQLWEKQMRINLLAPLLLMRDFAAHYKGRDGNIINITDGLAGWSMSQAFLSYTLSKQSLAHATELVAAELAPNFRVNAVAPGATLMSKHDTPTTFAKLAQRLPLRRVSSSQEVCDAVRYILSAPSLTGQILSLAGGI